MANSSDVVCGVCDALQVKQIALYWCHECEEGLCCNCRSHHTVSKASKNHGVIPIESYKKLPLSISEIVKYCIEHEFKYTNFCHKHNSLCCPGCISSSHKACHGSIVLIQELVKASNTSIMLKNIEQFSNDLKQNILKVEKDRLHNLSIIQEQRHKIQNEIENLRVQINLHLDKLEKNIIKNLIGAEKEVRSKIETQLTELIAESKSMDLLHNNIIAVTEYASDLQKCLGIKTIGDELETKKVLLDSLFEKNGCLNQLKISFHIDDKLSQILTNVTTFGLITIDTGPSAVDLTTKKKIQPTIIQQPPLKSINTVRLNLRSCFKILQQSTEKNIVGCTICPNGKIAFADYKDGRLVILNDDLTLDKSISCCQPINGPCDVTSIDRNLVVPYTQAIKAASSKIGISDATVIFDNTVAEKPISCSKMISGCISHFGPYDVTSIDDRTVAVTTSADILIINTIKKQTERTIRTSRPCYGITHYEGVLFWCEQSKGIQMLPLTEQSVTTVVKQDNLGEWTYLTTCCDKLYQTEKNKHTITCFTVNGKKLWEYTDTSVVKNPTKVAVDEYYNVYITSHDPNSVVVLSPDRKNSRQLLNKTNGLHSPWAMHCDIRKNELLVCNSDGSAFLYDISH